VDHNLFYPGPQTFFEVTSGDFVERPWREFKEREEETL